VTLQRTYKELHPFRSDEYLPFNRIDCEILVKAGLPQPQEVDDFLSLRMLLRDVAAEAATMFKDAVKDSHIVPEQPESFPLPLNLLEWGGEDADDGRRE
jgi:hypothetical protein